MSADHGELNGEKIVSDVIKHLTTNYDIDRDQIETCVNMGQYVTVTLKGTSDFPGFGHSSVNVFEMSEEIKYGYVPRIQWGRERLDIWTTKQTTPEWE